MEKNYSSQLIMILETSDDHCPKPEIIIWIKSELECYFHKDHFILNYSFFGIFIIFKQWEWMKSLNVQNCIVFTSIFRFLFWFLWSFEFWLLLLTTSQKKNVSINNIFRVAGGRFIKTSGSKQDYRQQEDTSLFQYY